MICVILGSICCDLFELLLGIRKVINYLMIVRSEIIYGSCSFPQQSWCLMYSRVVIGISDLWRDLIRVNKMKAVCEVPLHDFGAVSVTRIFNRQRKKTTLNVFPSLVQPPPKLPNIQQMFRLKYRTFCTLSDIHDRMRCPILVDKQMKKMQI